MADEKTFAHLRFADDVFRCVKALSAVHKLKARDATELHPDAPDAAGWYVVMIEVAKASDVVEIVAKALALDEGIDTELLAGVVRMDGNQIIVEFPRLCGLKQPVH